MRLLTLRLREEIFEFFVFLIYRTRDGGEGGVSWKNDSWQFAIGGQQLRTSDSWQSVVTSRVITVDLLGFRNHSNLHRKR